MQIPVGPKDLCFYKNKFVSIAQNGVEEVFQPEIDQVRWWVEDPITGEQTDKNGVVKVQYPNNFFPEP
jgi:hypothetical protein